MPSPSLESQYADLLIPLKRSEESFAIDLCQRLCNYLTALSQGVTPSFNSAALLVQACIAIYLKKVDYVHELVAELYKTFFDINRLKTVVEEKGQKDKEKPTKESRVNVQSLSTEIKIGKNLSCLRKKNTKNISLKKNEKKPSAISIPVHLTNIEDEDKGEIFYDTRGEIVGKTLEFILNKCKITSSGWLLLPTLSLDLIPSDSSPPDSGESNISNAGYNDIDMLPASAEEILSTPADSQSSTHPQITPSDSQMTTHPDTQATTPPDSQTTMPPDTQRTTPPDSQTITPSDSQGTETDTTATPSLQSAQTIIPSSVNPSPPRGCRPKSPSPDDKETRCTPMEVAEHSESPLTHCSPEGIENIPDSETSCAAGNSLTTVRGCSRHALKLCQLRFVNGEVVVSKSEEGVVQKKCYNKGCACFPTKVKTSDSIPPSIDSRSSTTLEYCTRTFYSFDDRFLDSSMIGLEIIAFGKNSNFFNRLKDRLDCLRKLKIGKNDASEEDGDDGDVEEAEGVEMLRDADDDFSFGDNPLNDDDIRIDNEPDIPLGNPSRRNLPQRNNEENPMPQLELAAPPEGITDQIEIYTSEVEKFLLDSEVTQIVQQWEADIKPFLEEIDRRGPFDITLYGSRILDAFEDSNRKQTMFFQDFCQDMDKWLIHRYFMALLPLANCGNVNLESETRENKHDVVITLLSRKMHHMELEEFGHSSGSHS